MVSDQCVPGLTWWCNGHTIQTDMRVLNLGAFDAILGYDWLSTHSPMTCHWQNKTVEFVHKGQMVKLQGVSAVSSTVEALSADKLVKMCKSNDIWAWVLVTQVLEKQDPPPVAEIQALLEQYKDVFSDPKTLPPPRVYDHTIPLIPGAVPVNSKPYRYSPQHKDEIERQVKEVVYKKGKDNVAADALSRVGHLVAIQAVSIAQNVWVQEVTNSYATDSQAQELLARLVISSPDEHGYSLQQGIIRFKDSIWVGSNSGLQTKDYFSTAF
ncbi:uncharacterized protein LOC112902286 [Panicum hallii]|uniref:uncharacterized protein LOC112902286 n=1 Tax=Panicum hallii TaxID=206008 RepID=UPI000DF4EC1C|nr:uncharacterized protein LOC112902286 [Panicum hallii]